MKTKPSTGFRLNEEISDWALLDQNPVEGISYSKKIHGVLMNGFYQINGFEFSYLPTIHLLG